MCAASAATKSCRLRRRSRRRTRRAEARSRIPARPSQPPPLEVDTGHRRGAAARAPRLVETSSPASKSPRSRRCGRAASGPPRVRRSPRRANCSRSRRSSKSRSPSDRPGGGSSHARRLSYSRHVAEVLRRSSPRWRTSCFPALRDAGVLADESSAAWRRAALLEAVAPDASPTTRSRRGAPAGRRARSRAPRPTSRRPRRRSAHQATLSLQAPAAASPAIVAARACAHVFARPRSRAPRTTPRSTAASRSPETRISRTTIRRSSRRARRLRR